METQSGSSFIFVGNNLALDFVNTEIVRHNQPVDLLPTFADFVSWLAEAGALDGNRAQEALRRWDGTTEANTALRQALELRAHLRAMAQQVTQGQAVPDGSLASLNAMLRRRSGYAQVVSAEGAFRRVFHLEWHEAGDLLVPIAEAAADLLCQGDLSLIHKCENPKCILYYYDTSKNHARRWCSMSACGNRAKAAAHYRRVRGAASE